MIYNLGFQASFSIFSSCEDLVCLYEEYCKIHHFPASVPINWSWPSCCSLLGEDVLWYMSTLFFSAPPMAAVWAKFFFFFLSWSYWPVLGGIQPTIVVEVEICFSNNNNYQMYFLCVSSGYSWARDWCWSMKCLPHGGEMSRAQETLTFECKIVLAFLSEVRSSWTMSTGLLRGIITKAPLPTTLPKWKTNPCLCA